MATRSSDGVETTQANARGALREGCQGPTAVVFVRPAAAPARLRAGRTTAVNIVELGPAIEHFSARHHHGVLIAEPPVWLRPGAHAAGSDFGRARDFHACIRAIAAWGTRLGVAFAGARICRPLRTRRHARPKKSFGLGPSDHRCSHSTKGKASRAQREPHGCVGKAVTPRRLSVVPRMIQVLPLPLEAATFTSDALLLPCAALSVPTQGARGSSVSPPKG